MLHVFGQSVGQFNDFESGLEIELESESELQNDAEISVFVEIVEMYIKICGRIIVGLCFFVRFKVGLLEVFFAAFYFSLTLQFLFKNVGLKLIDCVLDPRVNLRKLPSNICADYVL